MQQSMKERIVADAVVGAVKQVEAQLDEEINRLDSLNDTDLEAIRQKRLSEMKRAAENAHKWKLQGHGQLRVIAEREFFDRAKQSERFVCIFHRQSQSYLVEDFIEHISRIAEQHVETLFTSLNAENAPFLVDKFRIRVLPSVIFVKNGQVEKVLHGLSELDATGKFDTVRLEQALFELGALTNTKLADDS